MGKYIYLACMGVCAVVSLPALLFGAKSYLWVLGKMWTLLAIVTKSGDY